ncbi:hypothetical protein DP115_31530 [Brasilonema octagenarum UFV-OR1]|uniref:Transposase n=1 Tax=Brasilonema octagenarum UFV-OR1 TaxID=417115 RepID=A0ABX1MHX4_9CYAN|nr:hypothetical protein [Brasilonema octagenarum UFV-OR1]
MFDAIGFCVVSEDVERERTGNREQGGKKGGDFLRLTPLIGNGAKSQETYKKTIICRVGTVHS